MIVPMKKVFLLVVEKEKKSALRKLSKLGVLHIETIPGESAELTELLERKEKTESALMNISNEQAKDVEEIVTDESVAASVEMEDVRVREEIEHILALAEQKKEAFEELAKLNREYDKLSVWGNFDPRDIGALQEKGVLLRLYQVSKDEFETIEAKDKCFIVNKTKNMVRFAFVAGGEEELPPFPAVALPEMGLTELEERTGQLEQDIRNVDETLCHKHYVRKAIEKELEEIDGKIYFEQAHLSMGVDEKIAYLKGFAPEETAGTLKEAAAKNCWGLRIEDPSEDDEVPTLVKNPKWIRIIQPIFDLIGTVPGYREYDISFFFLFFFSIFFAMIIGDAGYGSILFIGALIGIIKGAASKKGVSTATALLAVLSLSTIGWGAVTGTWFGSEYIVDNTFLSRLVIDRVATFNPRSSETVKFICFVIGTVQIAIAHVWKFITELKKKPVIRAFTQLGWFIMVLGLYYLVLSLVLNTGEIREFTFLDRVLKPVSMPGYSTYMLIAGAAMVILFSKQEGRFFKGILKGFGGFLTTFLDSIGAFSDIISYIRLFAVGLATVEIAKSFNEMAAGSGNGVTGIIGGAIILIFGHTLNLAMGALSVIVHGVRLNMLEFSGHLGMEWTGRPYTPLRERGSEYEDKN